MAQQTDETVFPYFMSWTDVTLLALKRLPSNLSHVLLFPGLRLFETRHPQASAILIFEAAQTINTIYAMDPLIMRQGAVQGYHNEAKFSLSTTKSKKFILKLMFVKH